jgi:ribonuclease HI
MKKILIYTDGGCVPNPGIGGYGVVIQHEDKSILELSQGYIATTNNRMELLSVIKALEVITEKSKILIKSDSKYVIDPINKKWINRWIQNNWKLNKNKPVKNVDLWIQLEKLLKKHDITFKWIKGHSGNMINDQCDKLATKAINSTNLLIDKGYKIKGG